MAKTVDAIFYHGKAEGGINVYSKVVGASTWEVHELMNDKGKVYFRLYVLWHDISEHDYYTSIRKEFLQTPVTPHQTVVNPF